VKHPRRYAVFFGEEYEAYFVGTQNECERFIRESGRSHNWNLQPLATCSREQTREATA
jgi:hypothetical protein